MSQDWVKDILDFHRGMKQPSEINPHSIDINTYYLRRDLIKEEIEELLTAMAEDNIVKVADGIVDSIVVLIGTALAYGIDISPIWDEVHKTNMAKLVNPTFREDGKLLKPKDWQPPKIAEILERQIR